MALPWWERFPGRLEREYRDLEAVGIRFVEIAETRTAGVIQLELRYVPPGRPEVHLVATYPDAYPYTRPEVVAPAENLSRHQHPFAKNLCLLPRGTELWDIDHTLAQYITERVPLMYAAVDAADRGEPSPVPEQRQGEPFSDYYATELNAALLIDSSWELERTVPGGQLDLFIDERSNVIRGLVERLRNRTGVVLVESDPALRQAVPNGKRLTGRWIRAKHPPPQELGGRWTAFDDALRAVDPALARPPNTLKYGRPTLDVIGVVFDEEVGEDRWEDGWIFRVQRFDGRMPARPYLVRAVRAGRSDLRERTPETRGLADKKVIVLGLGGVGAPAALELARAGIGELRLVDHDIVDAGPVVRWPFGLASVGRAKVDVLGEWIERNLPYTKVWGVRRRLGGIRGSATDIPEADFVASLFDGADLVLDATAEYGLHVYVADLARDHGIPYVEASTKAGAWGGVVARILPGEGRPCWICYEEHLRQLEDGGGGPATDPAGLTQPLGCADPTFTGMGFDVAEFGLAAARLAVATLLRGVDGAYPDPTWDVGILNIRERDGSFGSPTWSVFPLEPHPNCPRRAQHAA